MERLHMNEVRELIHRLREGEGVREIAREMALSRNTVRKYRDMAQEEGLLDADKALSDWGYNRDKKQIVGGLLCDEEGEPVSVEVFRGNTQGVTTLGARVRKVTERFGCERVTFVRRPGDDQEWAGRRPVARGLSLHHGTDAPADRSAFAGGRVADGLVRRGGL